MTFTQRHPQLVKELHPLLLPWIGAVVAGSLIALRPLVDGEGLEGLLAGVVGYGFLGGLALVSTIAFGQELQERTLPLLLTQPLSRNRLWSGKMLLVATALPSAGLVVFGLLAAISSGYPGEQLWAGVRAAFKSEEILMAGVFLLATACSAGYWTLVAGSILGGLVFTIASQFLSALGVALVWSKLRGYEQLFQDPTTLAALGVAGLVYAGVFLWLGWRKFVRLEVRTTGFGDEVPASVATVWRLPWLRFLICRPSSRVVNFVRKELRLQKPIAQLAAAFTLCWMCVVLLQWLRPRENITYLFDVLTCLYAPVSSLLAGCISLGEEKAMGLTASQLALPFSTWLQWLLKLAVCAGTAAILGLGLPIMLFWVTGAFANLHSSGLMNPSDNGILALACISALMFLLGYWAISLTANTVRAALVAIAGMIILPALAALGAYCGGLLVGVTESGGPTGVKW